MILLEKHPLGTLVVRTLSEVVQIVGLEECDHGRSLFGDCQLCLDAAPPPDDFNFAL